MVTEGSELGNMMQDRRLSRAISDAAWSSFNVKLAYKAERAGKLFVRVDPAYTSQICPNRDRMEAKTLSQRTHDRPCVYMGSRDRASSLVILSRGIEKVRSERPELTLVDGRPLCASKHVAQVSWMKQEAPP